MMNINFWRIRLAVFGLAFIFAVLTVNISRMFPANKSAENITANYQNQEIVKVKNESKKQGGGTSGLSGRKSQCWENCRVCKCEDESPNVRPKKDKPENSANSKPLKITYKPHPKYTEEARNNNIQGNIRLRVTFLPNGKIGSVSEVAGLPFGLTEGAIEAAKKIKFKPQTHNGKPVAVTRVVAYTFSIY